MEKTLSILIIEDYENDAVLLLSKIRQYGFLPHYQIVSTSKELENALDKEKWDIVISDYMLPGFGGLEALKLIQARNPDIPVIMVSGKINDEVALGAIRAGAKDYFTKDDLGRLGFSIERELLELNIRKQTKEGMLESEAFSVYLLNNAPNPVVVISRDTSIKYVNPSFEKLTGFTASELIGAKPAYPYWSMKSPPGVPSNFEKVIWSKTSYRAEKTFRKKNGELFQVEVAGVPVLDREGNLIYFISNWVDVTDRIKILEHLHKSEVFTNSLLNNCPNPILVTNSDHSIKYINLAFESLTGYSKSELIGRGLPFPWFTENTLQKYKKSGQPKNLPRLVNAERCCRKKDGTLFWVLANINPIKEGGKIKYLLGNWIDITDRKRAEEALRKSEEKYRLLYETMRDGFARTDMDGLIIESNKAFKDLIGYTESDIQSLRYFDITPAKWRAMETKILKEEILPRGFSRVYEKEYRRKNGTIVPIELRTSLVKDANGKPVEMWAIIRDITSRKANQAALLESEERYRAFFENSIDAILITSPAGEVYFANEAACRIFGACEQELRLASRNRVNISDPGFKKAMEELSKTGRFRGELNIKRVDGTVFPGDMSVSTFNDGKGNIKTSTIIRDISERKRIELALKESEERFASFMNHSPAIAWMKDENGNYVYLSQTYEKKYGVKIKEWQGKKDNQVWPLQIADEFMKNDRKVLESGRSIEVVERTVDKNEKPCYILSFKFPFRDSSGRKYVGGIGIDITDRKQAEDSLKHSQGQLRKFSVHLQEQLELEKKHLAAEIHDELGQMLTALKIDLSWLAKRIPSNLEPLSQKTQSIMELINDTDKVVKRISSNLRPPILDDLGLSEALGWLASQFQERTEIKCILKVPVKEICGKEQAVDMFRIVQEALTNVARHSGATSVRIAMQNEADSLVITIRDNGKGIRKSQIESDMSFGIMGMQERARILGGVLTIRKNNSKGTIVKIAVPSRK